MPIWASRAPGGAMTSLMRVLVLLSAVDPCHLLVLILHRHASWAHAGVRSLTPRRFNAADAIVNDARLGTASTTKPSRQASFRHRHVLDSC